MTLLLLNQKYLQMQRTRLAIIMKKREIRKKRLLAKIRTARRSWWVKKSKTNAWSVNFITNKVPESKWKDKFQMSRKSFYELCDMFIPYLEKKRTHLRTPISVDAQVGSYLYNISDEGRYSKNANAFGISRGSISWMIRRVSYAVTTFLGPKLIRLRVDWWIFRSTRFPTVHRCDWWNSYRNTRTKWTLFRFYQ